MVAERARCGGAETIDDLIAERWAKLSVNCYVNALGGISGLGSSTMRRDKLTVALGEFCMKNDEFCMKNDEFCI